MELTTADVAAIIMSSWALIQSSRYRGNDILLATIKERAEISEMLKGLDGAFDQLNDGWRALFAAQKMFESGARLQKEERAEKFQARIDELYKEFNSIAKPTGWRARSKAEYILPVLLELRARVSSFVVAVNADLLELKEEQLAFRNRPR